MSVTDLLRQQLNTALAPTHIEVINESSGHSRGQETHFKVIIVSKIFAGLSRVKRQQAVFAAAGDMLEGRGGPIHALTIVVATPEEWAAGSVANNASPACQGGHHGDDDGGHGGETIH